MMNHYIEAVELRPEALRGVIKLLSFDCGETASHIHEGVRDVPCAIWAAQRKAIQSFRLRLHFRLQQRGTAFACYYSMAEQFDDKT
jgi:hypothetical protein